MEIKVSFGFSGFSYNIAGPLYQISIWIKNSAMFVERCRQQINMSQPSQCTEPENRPGTRVNWGPTIGKSCVTGETNSHLESSLFIDSDPSIFVSVGHKIWSWWASINLANLALISNRNIASAIERTVEIKINPVSSPSLLADLGITGF